MPDARGRAEDVREALGRRLGGPPESLRAVGGGDIGESFRVRSDGRDWFAKRYAPPDGEAMVAAEARGLGWLREAGALRVPEVRLASGEWLVLEWVEPGRADRRTYEALGRGLAALHRAGAPAFGAEQDNFIGRLPQRNAPCASWAELYAEWRLRPILERAGLARPGSPGARLLERLPHLVGPDEPPSRLHGDLWGGNLLCSAEGAPVLVDPAAYGGHREVDLAMMKLFGGFPQRAFDAYREVHPLAPGHAERVLLYQLYPLLVHLALFGGSYLGRVEQAIRAYA